MYGDVSYSATGLWPSFLLKLPLLASFTVRRQAGCEAGRLIGQIKYEITDQQVWEQTTADGSTLLPEWLDKYSGCKVAERGITTCNADNTGTKICTTDSRPGSTTLGLNEYVESPCPAGTHCDPNVSAAASERIQLGLLKDRYGAGTLTCCSFTALQGQGAGYAICVA